MFSICIPIYNFDCTNLVNNLLDQIHAISQEIELIVVDDASSEEYQEKFRAFPKEVNFIQLSENIGRSKIRNLMGNKAKYDYLLFIDGDSTITSNKLLEEYLIHLDNNVTSGVICGGSVYQENNPDREFFLRWKYSKSRERKSVSFSKQHPYRSFTTNNFIIDKSTFLSILFDESIEEYGHEDTLFGYELMKRKVPIKHIDNVVLNGDLDKNEAYLQKVKLSVSNLLKIAKKLDYSQDFVNLIPLLKVYFRIKLFGLEIFLRIWFRLNKSRLEKKYISGKVNLIVFDFYRLGILSSIFKQN